MQLGKGGSWLSGASCVFLHRKDLAFKLLGRQPDGHSAKPWVFIRAFLPRNTHFFPVACCAICLWCM